jgi:hypothetical protein
MKPYAALVAAMLAFASSAAIGADSILANGTAANISNRARSGPGDDASICGFVVKDAATFVLIRAVGPGLAQFGVAGYASATTFDVADAKGASVTTGMAFAGFTAAEQAGLNARFVALGAFPLPNNSADSYAYLCLNPGSYTVVARPVGSSPGIILSEVYFDSTGIGALEPASFDTSATAADYVKQLFAGGKLDVVTVGLEDVLVLQTFGSGVPVVAIGSYRYAAGQWKLASEWSPQDLQRSYAVKEQDGDVVAIGSTTGEEWVLLEL